MNLDSVTADHFRINESQKKALKKLGIVEIRDLLRHFPIRYGNIAQIKKIADLVAGEEAVIFGKISKLQTKKAFVRKIPMSEAVITDETGNIKVMWFHQPYIAKMITEGSIVKAAGKVSERKGSFAMMNPKTEAVSTAPIAVGDSLFGENHDHGLLYPVYPESRGITSNWFFHTIQKIFKSGVLDNVDDPIPQEILSKYNLPSLKTALIWIHSPHKESDALSARKRFAFEEIFFIQLEKQRAKKLWEKESSFKISSSEEKIAEFISRFPFKLTGAQQRAISAIIENFKKPHPMARLLEGDVGSGKTAVAATATYAAVCAGYQVAYMAPTEILAGQHFQSFIEYFRHMRTQAALITGSGCKKFPSKVNPSGFTEISRAQLSKWVANGEIPIVIGTHALIQKSVKFKKLAFAIIDEQHRFGTSQRQKLVSKDGLAPHLLSMTATPIPRTLALTIFGDLDLTLLDEMPAGRKQIITEIVMPNKRDETYEKIRAEMSLGRQVYVICPRIDEPDPAKEAAVQAKSIKEEAKRLKAKVFQDKTIEILHSKMTPKAKSDVMNKFHAGKIDILVSTSVVEVGVNVPNATVIIIEGAERFGLAQLHQLRGRVLRSNHQAYCFVFADSKTEKTVERLKALKTARNGFELAEFDLAARGAGDLRGAKQWGISDLAMEGIRNIKMVEAAHLEAQKIIDDDISLSKYPLLKQKLDAQTHKIHFE